MIEIIKSYIHSPIALFLLLLVVSAVVGLFVRLIFFGVLTYASKKSNRITIQKLKTRLSSSVFMFLPLLFMHAFLRKTGIAEDWIDVIRPILNSLIIASITVVSVRLIFFIQDVLFLKFDISKEDNIRERQVITQIFFLRKMAMFAIILMAICVILLYGATILTSAGVAGVILGLAAQKTIGNLLAGIQIAFTQPIKIDDNVVVEGEWGWIEEINLTYVVVKIWDKRRMILPITYFTEQTYQNWTRNSSDIMGSVFLYMDYSIPIPAIREKFESILESNDLWDRQTKVLQITESSERTITVRLLMSARSAPRAWDLRCAIREEMLIYIQNEFPHALPKTRISLQKDAEEVVNRKA
jgi:small-conductance mechanosensitive channel